MARQAPDTSLRFTGMAKIKMQVARQPASALARDEWIQTFYLDTDELGTEPNYVQLATDAGAIWETKCPLITGWPRFEVRAYDLGDTSPRVPRARVKTLNGGYGTGAAAGPQEVALCLSYFAGTNLPRKRGRMYFGPFQVGQMATRPSDILIGQIGDFAAAISNLGGVNVDWVQYSPTTGAFSKVTNWWVDDEWDTQRSRGVKATKRITGTVSE